MFFYLLYESQPLFIIKLIVLFYAKLTNLLACFAIIPLCTCETEALILLHGSTAIAVYRAISDNLLDLCSFTESSNLVVLKIAGEAMAVITKA